MPRLCLLEQISRLGGQRRFGSRRRSDADVKVNSAVTVLSPRMQIFHYGRKMAETADCESAGLSRPCVFVCTESRHATLWWRWRQKAVNFFNRLRISFTIFITRQHLSHYSVRGKHGKSTFLFCSYIEGQLKEPLLCSLTSLHCLYRCVFEYIIQFWKRHQHYRQ